MRILTIVGLTWLSATSACSSSNPTPRRGDCGTAGSPPCVASEAQRRVAADQARNGTAKAIGPVRWICDDSAKSEVTVTFFETDPPTLIATRGDETSLMYSALAASGAKYEGEGRVFWEHQGEAMIAWGAGTPEMRCSKAP